MSSFWNIDDDEDLTAKAANWRIQETKTEDNHKTDAPLKALRPTSIKLLSTLLNPIKIIPTENGLLRDWRGLAELAGITTEKIIFIESKEDPTAEFIKSWMSQDTGRQLSDLKAFLAVIDRYDIWEDVTPFLETDIQFYWSRDQQKCTNNSDIVAIPNGADELHVDDANVLTVGDEGGKYMTRYDAFILYVEEDTEFAMKIVDEMETNYKLKMCVKDRDLLPGSMFEHEIITRVIEERCNRLLVVFSPDFLKSQANQFLVSYAQALGLELRQRKIIPCMFSRCELPPSVRYSFCLVYNRSGKLWNFFEKLSQSIKTTPAVPVPEKKSHFAALPSSSSLPTTPILPMALQDSIGWWESDKQHPSSTVRQKSSYSTSDSGIIDFEDTLSMHSSSPFIPSGSNNEIKSSSQEPKMSKSKWLKKLIIPVRKSRSKKDKVEQVLF